MRHLFSLCMHPAELAVYWKHIGGNKTRWILGAMAERYHRETGHPAQFVIDQEKQRLSRMMKEFRGDKEPELYVPPVVEDAPAPLVPPQRIGWWLPTPEEMETGIYTVLPETFAVNDEGVWHFVRVVPGPAYPYGDTWPGIKAKWKPSETEGPFTPSPGVLSAAIAADAARVAALIARHPR